jgi:hypothetical protein
VAPLATSPELGERLVDSRRQQERMIDNTSSRSDGSWPKPATLDSRADLRRR